MKWFGESWDAPVCERAEQTETPTGWLCEHCKKPIKKGDQGLVLVYYAEAEIRDWPIHLRCFAKALGFK